MQLVIVQIVQLSAIAPTLVHMSKCAICLNENAVNKKLELHKFELIGLKTTILIQELNQREREKLSKLLRWCFLLRLLAADQSLVTAAVTLSSELFKDRAKVSFR